MANQSAVCNRPQKLYSKDGSMTVLMCDFPHNAIFQEGCSHDSHQNVTHNTRGGQEATHNTRGGQEAHVDIGKKIQRTFSF